MPSIEDLAKARVVVVGDVIVDLYVHGRVERISPEAPVPVFVEERRRYSNGGAGNVVENLRALGCATAYPFASKAAHKTRYVVNRQQIFRADEEDCAPIDEVTQALCFERSTAQPCDVLVLSDYAKGALPAPLCRRLIEWAKGRGIKVVVDPKGKDWGKYEGCDVLTPNESEWDAVDQRTEPDAALVVTRGADGMTVHPDDLDGVVDILATNTGPVDVIGAGDTVVAVLAAALAVGFGLEQAARLANAAAGVSVGKFGTATCSLAELEKAMGEQARQPSEISRRVNSKLVVVGFANGVFDRFHDGHRHFLRECQMNCDRLVVALNHGQYAIDKGAIDDWQDRAAAVQKYANAVESFDGEAELLALIKRAKPDVIFKGEDWRGKPVTGGELARIHWVARHPGYSSTIERMKAKA